jgi:tetratricopeptide (TPR) repeat protein
LAAIKLKAADYRAAEELYQLGDRHFPASERWVSGLARIYLQPGSVADSQAKLVPVLRRWNAAEPENLTIQKKLAELALAQQDYAAAAAAALAVIHRDVEDAAAHAALAEARTGQGKLGMAVEEYQTALRLDPKQPDWQAALTKLLLRHGKKDEALAALGRLRELDPKHPQLAELEKSLDQ